MIIEYNSSYTVITCLMNDIWPTHMPDICPSPNRHDVTITLDIQDMDDMCPMTTNKISQYIHTYISYHPKEHERTRLHRPPRTMKNTKEVLLLFLFNQNIFD